MIITCILLYCIVLDLFMYHQSLQKNLVLTKVAITELCLAHIVFRAVFQDRSMDYLLIVAYALEVSELTSQVCKHIFLKKKPKNKFVFNVSIYNF